MINIIWGFFIIIGIIYALITNNINIINSTILESGKNCLDMMIQIFPVMAVWLGLMNIAKESGLLTKFSNKISPLLKFLFPDIPKNHESLGYIASNIVINIFGLGSAATPFGLKAMKSLQEINPKKDTASRSMITFLVLNTSGVTIVPTTIISLRMMHGSSNPTGIVILCVIATSCSTIGGLIMDRILARRYNK
ncbi:MAG TPA: nucleoside recognition domain-containing protein [Bacilli bacterium]|nr:nucleoside recognition domain-containing protein [Bacilli bacterium]